ncbi:methylosome protein 50-like [Trichogramma pretiosum]|uniref:methylosome protein 50-like n=1 Tax=Trichogramma pretiosum TaxID=7493 RepID=UPI0006C93C25|nr:methylosome protein 50-like [Trichogramma pretiosum]
MEVIPSPLIDPNANAEAYRSLAGQNQQPGFDKQLEFLIIHKDESLVLGASNMQDRYWSGSLWYHKNVDNFSHENYLTSIKTESGARAACYLGKFDTFAIGEDSGLLQIFNLNYNPVTKKTDLHCIGYSCQHDDSITSISKFEDDSRIVTAGMDSSIKVWDTKDMVATHSYSPAHLDAVTCVATQPGSNEVFVSTSLDHEVLLWDTRKAKPATGLWDEFHCGFTAVSWKPIDGNIIALGAQDGSITVIDIRHSKEALENSIQFSRGVHKLSFNPDKPAHLAGCCDSENIKVFDVDNSLEILYENESHDDFVRDLAWHKNDLLTCSWDFTVLRHTPYTANSQAESFTPESSPTKVVQVDE